MPDATLAARYDNAAPRWTGMVAGLGFHRAYGGFARAAMAPLDNTSRVCDIGTGCGTFALAALDIGASPASLTLVDPAANMLEHACEALAPYATEVLCHQSTLETFQTDQRYNLVLCAHVIEHCADPVQALTKIYRLVAPGGRLLLVISRPHWCQWLIWLRWRHRWYSEARVRDMARSADLPAAVCHRFMDGPPQRTSFGYCFIRPKKGTNMLIVIVEFQVAADDRPAAMAALLAETQTVRAMPGCIAFRPFVDAQRADTCRIVHEWESEEQFAAYTASPGFAAVGEILRPMMTVPPISRRFRAELMETVA